MPRPIEIPSNGRGSELPDFFQDLSFPISHTLIPNGTKCVLLFYAERDLVIDSVIIGVAATDGITCQLLSVTDPSNTTGTAIHDTAVSLSATGNTKPTVNISNNVVPTGNWLLAKYSGSSNTLHMAIHIRYRTRQA
jgi:hypothetical protein